LLGIGLLDSAAHTVIAVVVVIGLPIAGEINLYRLHDSAMPAGESFSEGEVVAASPENAWVNSPASGNGIVTKSVCV